MLPDIYHPHPWHDFQRIGTTIVVVSHSLDLIASFCERVIWLEHGRIIADGVATEVVQQYPDDLPHAAEVGI